MLKSFRELDAEDPATPEDRKEMLANLKRMAKRNIHAFEIYRDTIGEKPANKMELSGSVSNPSERFASFSDDELRQAIEALQKKSGQERG